MGRYRYDPTYVANNAVFNNAMDSLMHYGVMGMKWGVRNDETLRKYGEKKYGKMSAEKLASKRSSAERKIQKANSKIENTEAKIRKQRMTKNYDIKMQKASESARGYEKKAERYQRKVERWERRHPNAENHGLISGHNAKKFKKYSAKADRYSAQHDKYYDRDAPTRRRQEYVSRIKRKTYSTALKAAAMDSVARAKGKAFFKEYKSLRGQNVKTIRKYSDVANKYNV